MIQEYLVFILVFWFSLSIGDVMAQSESDFHIFMISEELEETSPSSLVSNVILEDRNELDVSLHILYKVYRELISSQDGSNCRFYPTCSAFCKESLSRHGIIKGSVMGMDRLTRCNGLSPSKYEIDLHRRRLVDNVP